MKSKRSSSRMGPRTIRLVLTYSGQSTGELDYDATSEENVATALKALNNIGDSDVVVTDGDPAGWVVEFTGALGQHGCAGNHGRLRQERKANDRCDGRGGQRQDWY